MAKIRTGRVPSDHPVVPELEDFGFTAHLERNVPLSLIRTDNPFQVREDPEDSTRARQYKTAMMAGAKFYAPVVTSDYATVDGNGRLDAYRLMKLPVIPELVVIEIDSGIASEDELTSLTLIGGTLNENGPKKLSPSDKRRMVIHGIERGLSNEQLARRFTASSNMVSGIRAEVRASERLQSAGLKVEELKLPATIARILGGNKAGTLLKQPLRDFAELVSDAGIKEADVRQELSGLTGMASEKEQIDHITNLRTELESNIREYKLTGDRPVPSPARTARQAIGNIYPKFKHDPRLLIQDIPADSRKEYIAVYEGTARVLEMAAREMRQEDNYWES